MSVLCPIMGCAASTAYARKGCRCDVCRAEITASRRRLRGVPKATPYTTSPEIEQIVQEAIEGLGVDTGLLVYLAELARKSVEGK